MALVAVWPRPDATNTMMNEMTAARTASDLKPLREGALLVLIGPPFSNSGPTREPTGIAKKVPVRPLGDKGEHSTPGVCNRIVTHGGFPNEDGTLCDREVAGVHLPVTVRLQWEEFLGTLAMASPK